MENAGKILCISGGGLLSTLAAIASTAVLGVSAPIAVVVGLAGGAASVVAAAKLND